MDRRLIGLCALIVAASPLPALSAQLPGLGSLSGGGPALAGALVPGLSSIGMANATGILGYCVKRKLLAGTSAQSILGKLTGQPGVADSSNFAAGQDGKIVTKNGQFSLDGMKDSLKGKVCSTVLDHAQTFVGR